MGFNSLYRSAIVAQLFLMLIQTVRSAEYSDGKATYGYAVSYWQKDDPPEGGQLAGIPADYDAALELAERKGRDPFVVRVVITWEVSGQKYRQVVVEKVVPEKKRRRLDPPPRRSDDDEPIRRPGPIDRTRRVKEPAATRADDVVGWWQFVTVRDGKEVYYAGGFKLLADQTGVFVDHQGRPNRGLGRFSWSFDDNEVTCRYSDGSRRSFTYKAGRLTHDLLKDDYVLRPE